MSILHGLAGFLGHSWLGLLVGAGVMALAYFTASVRTGIVGAAVIAASVYVGTLYAEIESARIEVDVFKQQAAAARADMVIAKAANDMFAATIKSQNARIAQMAAQAKHLATVAKNAAETEHQHYTAAALKQYGHGAIEMNLFQSENLTSTN